jgi:CBS domain containing-hemolysin-like protein
VTNRFAALQRHIASAVAAIALSAFFVGAAIAPVSVQQDAGTEQSAQA